MKAKFVATAMDVVVMKDDEHPEWRWSVYVSEDGPYLALYVTQDTSRVQNLAAMTNVLCTHEMVFRKT